MQTQLLSSFLNHEWLFFLLTPEICNNKVEAKKILHLYTQTSFCKYCLEKEYLYLFSRQKLDLNLGYKSCHTQSIFTKNHLARTKKNWVKYSTYKTESFVYHLIPYISPRQWISLLVHHFEYRPLHPEHCNTIPSPHRSTSFSFPYRKWNNK